MSLTAQSLKIDQRQPGWGDQARLDGPRLLEAAGCAALARQMRENLRAEPTLEVLSRFLRLEVTAGRATERACALNGTGPVDGSGWRPAVVPRRPKLLTLTIPAEPEMDYIGACQTIGDILLVGRGYGPGQCARLQALRLTERLTLELLWSHDVSCFTSKMATDGRVVIIEGWQGSAFTEALRLEDGEVLWRFGGGGLPNPTDSISSGSRTLVAADGVALMLHSGAASRLDPYERWVITALELESGALLWQRAVPEETQVASDLGGDPTGLRVGEGVLFHHVPGALDQALCLRTGAPLWGAPQMPPAGTVYIQGGSLTFWHRPTAALTEYDLEGGVVRRHQKLLEHQGAHLVGETGGLRLFSAGSDRLAAIDAEGKSVWKKTLSRHLLLEPRLLGDAALCLSPDGHLSAFGAADGEELWSVLAPKAGGIRPLGEGLLLNITGAPDQDHTRVFVAEGQKD